MSSFLLVFSTLRYYQIMDLLCLRIRLINVNYLSLLPLLIVHTIHINNNLDKDNPLDGSNSGICRQIASGIREYT